jgi:hypothetical protein
MTVDRLMMDSVVEAAHGQLPPLSHDLPYPASVLLYLPKESRSREAFAMSIWELSAVTPYFRVPRSGKKLSITTLNLQEMVNPSLVS